MNQKTHRGEEMHRVVQYHQFGARLDTINGAVQEQCFAVCLQIPAHMVLLLTDLRFTCLKPAYVEAG